MPPFIAPNRRPAQELHKVLREGERLAEEADRAATDCALIALITSGPDVEWAEPNHCRDKQLAVPNDPYFRSRGSRGQD